MTSSGQCRSCAQTISLTPGGRLTSHAVNGQRCSGSGREPVKLDSHEQLRNDFPLQCARCGNRLKPDAGGFVDRGARPSCSDDKKHRPAASDLSEEQLKQLAARRAQPATSAAEKVAFAGAVAQAAGAATFSFGCLLMLLPVLAILLFLLVAVLRTFFG